METTRAFHIRPEDTVKTLKHKIYKRTAIHVKDQRLYYDNQQLQNCLFIKDYDLEEDMKLVLLLSKKKRGHRE